MFPNYIIIENTGVIKHFTPKYLKEGTSTRTSRICLDKILGYIIGALIIVLAHTTSKKPAICKPIAYICERGGHW